MNEPSEQDRLAAFLQGVESLPPWVGLAFRGVPAGTPSPAPGQAFVTTGILSASRSVAIASQGWAVTEVVALSSATGRDLAPVSAQRAAAEVVWVPGSAFMPLGVMDVGPLRVHIVAELVQHEGSFVLPSDDVMQRLGDAVREAVVRQATQRSDVPWGISTDRFAGPLPV